MPKWNVGDFVEIVHLKTYSDGWYGGYHLGEFGTVVEVGHRFLRLNLDGNRKWCRVLKEECKKAQQEDRVLSRIKLIHSRQSNKYPFMGGAA